VAKVRLSVPAVDDLDRMIVTHSLPADTRLRVQRSLRVLEQFPRIGRQLEGRWASMRVILGPWRWMLIIYNYEEPGDVVLIAAFQDAKASVLR
jgi:plasmid stabilization system protein ParE